MDTKHCYMCGEHKPLISFNKDSKKLDGLQTKCRECTAAYFQDYYAKNKRSILDKSNARKRQKRQEKAA